MSKAKIIGDASSNTYPAVKIKCTCGNVIKAFRRSWAGNGKAICKGPKGCGKAIEYGTLNVRNSDTIDPPTAQGLRQSLKEKGGKSKRHTTPKAVKRATAKATKPKAKKAAKPKLAATPKPEQSEAATTA